MHRFDAAPPAIQVVVNVYGDGSILVNHGGIEMGQGLATKVKQVRGMIMQQHICYVILLLDIHHDPACACSLHSSFNWLLAAECRSSQVAC